MSGGVFREDTAASREASGGRRGARLAAAVDGLMTSPEGRDFLRWLLTVCRSFEAQAPGAGASPLAERLIFAEGARQVGMRLLRLLQTANAAHFPNLLLTREDDDDADGCGGDSPAGLHAR